MEESDENTTAPLAQKKRHRHRKKQLYASILKQMEFYFSDASLSKDRFLGELIHQDPLIPLDVFLKFNKVKTLTDNITDIAKALRDSSLLEVTEDGTKVKRVAPLTLYDVDSRTVYVESIPPSAGIDWLTEVFQVYGPIAYISLPKYYNTKRIKGFAFVEFVNPEDANVCLDAFAMNGCKLATTTRPDALYSYQGFQPDLPPSKQEEAACIEDEVFLSSEKTDDTEPPMKKAKRKDCFDKNDENNEISSIAEIETPEEVSQDLHQEIKSPKDKEESDALSKEIESEEQSDVDAVQQDEAETGKEPDVKTVTKKLKPLRKRKKKDRKKPQKEREKSLEGAARGLQVLSKRDWKILRNKYLNMQRKHMKELKQSLRMQHTMPEPQSRQPTPMPPATCPTYESSMGETERDPAVAVIPDIPFIEGVIVAAKLSEPCIDVKKLKSATKANIHVKFVDAKEGSFDVHVRLDDADAAKQLAVSGVFPEAYVLTGEMEKKYWEELRKQQSGRSSSKRKIRGRERLVKKALALAPSHLINQPGKHIRFDE